MCMALYIFNLTGFKTEQRPIEKVPDFRYSQHKQHSSSEPSQQVSPNMHKPSIEASNVSDHLPTHQAEKSASQEKPEYTKSLDVDDGIFFKMERNKRASRSKELKDADIPDLSDENRPTRIAEKFSELYDNEWADLFDLLESCRNVKESGIIKELLLLVQDAYTFCKDEADKQIKNMHFDFIKVMCGKTPTANMEIAGTGHLKEFRKANAAYSLPSLQEDFFEKRIKYMHWKPELKDMPPPSRSDKVGKFADKAIELTWWMNVHVPPVYMCPTTVETFDTNLYKAYTKAGSQPDIFVWPALKLTQDGEILVKGIVQFK